MPKLQVHNIILHTSSGKKIDTWKMSLNNSAGHGISAEVEVKMMRNHDGDGGIKFVATVIHGPGKDIGASWESESINTLRTMVEQGLSELLHTASGVTWEDWLEVIVSGDSRSVDFSTFRDSAIAAKGLRVEYKTIRRGTHPDYRDKVFRQTPDGNAVRFPSPKNAGEEDPDINAKDVFSKGRETGYAYSYIPDTPSVA